MNEQLWPAPPLSSNAPAYAPRTSRTSIWVLAVLLAIAIVAIGGLGIAFAQEQDCQRAFEALEFQHAIDPGGCEQR